MGANGTVEAPRQALAAAGIAVTELLDRRGRTGRCCVAELVAARVAPAS